VNNRMTILEKAMEIKNEITSIRRLLHKNPELSLQEFETAKLVASVMEEHGIEVTTGVGGTGVVGLISGSHPGRTIALRADMDALPVQEDTGVDCISCKPGIMHACGHDIHTTVLLGTAIVLSKCRDQIKGNVKFVFQPAEEIGKGALNMIGAGVLENPHVDAMMGLHCWPELPAGIIGVRKRAFMAAGDSFVIKIKGRGGHSAHPHKSIDPVVIAAYVVIALQTVSSREISPVDSVVLTINRINSDAKVGNVIPSNVEMHGSFRTISPETRKRIPEIIKRIACKTAESLNGKAEVSITLGGPPLINDDEFVDLVDEVTKEILGNDKLVYLEHPSMGGEDFAQYLQMVPGMMFRLGTADETEQSKLALHTSRIVFNEDAMVNGIAVMSESALRFLNK